MSTVRTSNDLSRLPEIVLREFSAAQDEAAEVLAREWRGQIIAIDLIDSGNYLQAIEVGGEQLSGDVRTITIDAERASGYAGAIRRKGEADYAGQRVAEDAVRTAEPGIRAALDKAGDRIR